MSNTLYKHRVCNTPKPAPALDSAPPPHFVDNQQITSVGNEMYTRMAGWCKFSQNCGIASGLPCYATRYDPRNDRGGGGNA
jgi:hypothetical protein